MTWRIERHPTGQAGFTLFEMLIVLVVLGLVLAMLAGRSTTHSRSLSLRATAEDMAAGLRLTRSAAILRNRPAAFRIDLAGRAWQPAGGPVRRFPPDLAVMLVGMSGGALRFDPDGGASGGRIELEEGQARAEIAVDWLTGRVSVADGR
jgi:general secretion pathway protein H